MSENPYKTPEDLDSRTASKNTLGSIGFTLSLIGFAGLLVVGPLGPLASTVGMYLAFLCLPGLIVSIVGVFRKPKRLAKWGIGIGLFGSLYLPTFYLSLFH